MIMMMNLKGGEACASQIFSCHVPRACEARAESWTPSSVSLHVKHCAPSPTKGCKEAPLSPPPPKAHLGGVDGA